MDNNKEKFDIIIQAGQSNSEGYGIGKTSEEHIESGDILYFKPDLSITQAREEAAIPTQDWLFAGKAKDMERKINNLSLAFSREYVRTGMLQSGRKLLIIRAAVGGTGFSDRHWGLEDDLYLRMIGMIKNALSLNPENRIVVFLWHQGETDAVNKVNRETHYQNLKRLVTSVRTGFACQMPFIAGDFVHEWKNQNIKVCEPVIAAIKDVCRELQPAAFVETDGLNSNNQDTYNGDIIHFSSKALNTLGKRYFDAFCEIKGGGKKG